MLGVARGCAIASLRVEACVFEESWDGLHRCIKLRADFPFFRTDGSPPSWEGVGSRELALGGAQVPVVLGTGGFVLSSAMRIGRVAVPEVLTIPVGCVAAGSFV